MIVMIGYLHMYSYLSNLLHNARVVKHFEQLHVIVQPIAALLDMLDVLQSRNIIPYDAQYTVSDLQCGHDLIVSDN